MKIGGLEKLTLIDYSDKVAAVVFTQGCNFRCHFCYNPLLVWPKKSVSGKENNEKEAFSMTEEALFHFLKSRLNKLDALVISGGEPTLHSDLPEFIQKIKNLGFLVKLDTNGTNPKMLKNLMDRQLIDYIAMDIKAPYQKYEQVVGIKVDLQSVQNSVTLLIEGRVPYEFRTTLVPKYHSQEDIVSMAKNILKARLWYLQKFISDTNLVNKNLQNEASFTDLEMKNFVKIASQYVKKCEARGLN
jgi:pyruvate formate lyase activating enzyme